MRNNFPSFRSKLLFYVLFCFFKKTTCYDPLNWFHNQQHEKHCLTKFYFELTRENKIRAIQTNCLTFFIIKRLKH